MFIISVLFLLLKRKGKGSYIRQIIIVIILFVLNLRIMVRSDDVPMVMPNVDVLFVVDNTISMLAEDYGDDNDKRMDAVKADCQYITEQLSGASFSLVKFDDSVEQMIPYTVDANMLIDTVGLLHAPTEYYAKGTSFNKIMSNMKTLLSDERGNYKIIFFISDGEMTSEEELKSYDGLAQLVDGGAVLGYGTTTGGPMRPFKYAEDGEIGEYLYHYNEEFEKTRSLSKIDEGNLKKIATDFGVDYVHMTKRTAIDHIIKELQSDINNLEMTQDLDSKEGYEDTYYLLIIPLLILLVIDCISYKRKVC